MMAFIRASGAGADSNEKLVLRWVGFGHLSQHGRPGITSILAGGPLFGASRAMPVQLNIPFDVSLDLLMYGVFYILGWCLIRGVVKRCASS